MLDLAKIRTDGETQARVALNAGTVADYAEAYRNGENMPAVIVFYDGSHYWLADGFHRYFGAKDAGQTSIFEDIRPGTQRDAVLYSVGANARHGLQRSNEDKRRAVMTLLNDAEWSKWTDVAIAKACGVSSNFVGDMRKSIINPINDSPVRTVERNGTTYQQDTSKIGKPQTMLQPSGSMPPAAPKPSGAPPQNRMPTDLQTAVDDLEQEEEGIRALAERNTELEEENRILRLAVDPKVLTKIQELKAQVKVVEGQRNDWQNQCAELKKEVKRLQRQLAKVNA